ncbi:MAG: hypothetical protein IJS63_03440 [Bacteroidaceae bacterium]|nr:hypothetical protein [Bacteroidaceae bacterium]
MKKHSLILLSLMVCCFVEAQTFHEANVGGILFGQGWSSEVGTKYQRFPDRAQSVVPSGVWSLSKQPAGVNVRFVTNATSITVKYTLAGGAAGYTNMPATLQSGVDLYAHTPDGQFYYVSPKKFTFSTTTTYTYSDLNPQELTGKDECEYVLFFPMYNNVNSMKIGVPAANTFEFVTVPEDDQPIVVYGSSIAQGCSASRPGMAWPAIVARELNTNVINLGFSGSAMMESGLFDMMKELTNAKLFIIDPVPNIKGQPSSIVSRTINGVKKLREVSQAPILLVESLGNSNKVMQPNEQNIDSRGNKKLREAFETLMEDGEVQNVFYLSEEEIGLTEDGMIEGTHPNDIGMREYADAYIQKINWLFENLDNSQPPVNHPLFATVREAKKMLKSWIFGTNPGETPVELQGQMQALIAEAQEAIDTDVQDETQCNAMKQALEAKMKELRETRNPMQDGFYYIVSAYDGFMDSKGYEMAMYTRDAAVNWTRLDSTSLAYVYKFKKTANNRWAVQNCATGTYINTSATQKPLTMSTTLQTEQILKEEKAWSARFRMYNTANTLPYIPNSNQYGACEGADVFNQSETMYSSNDPSSLAYGWYTWYIRAVTDEEVLERIAREMKTEQTVALEQALKQVMTVYEKALDIKADKTSPLITEANDDDDEHNQFSSNAKMPEGTNNWGYYRNLLDGDASTYFITVHNVNLATPPADKHYLQVDLRDNPVDAFIFHFVPNTTFPTFSWRDLTVTASNDAENWDVITDLNGLPNNAPYDSPCVWMWQPYRHVRFTVNGTQRALVAGGGECFCIGDFQMYPAKPSDSSPYTTNPAVKTAADELSEAMAEARQKVASNSATQADVDELLNCMAALQALLN